MFNKVLKTCKQSFLLIWFYPLMGSAESKSADKISDADKPMQAAFKNQFDIRNVGNLHVFTHTENETDSDYFSGEKLPRGLYGLFDVTWRSLWPEAFDAYAVYTIKHEVHHFT